jgi:hypothetical protein
LAFKTDEREQGMMGSLMAHVDTTDPTQWLGVWPKLDGTYVDPDWFKNYYKWGKPTNGLLAVDDSYSLKTNACGAVTNENKVSMF